MKNFLLIILTSCVLGACNEYNGYSSVDPVNWKSREVSTMPLDSLVQGKSYLSVYSQIYSGTEHRTHDLTATVSIRNTHPTDTIYIDKAEYFDTHGESIRTYFNHTIFIAPMETVEIVIDEGDKEGGTGANFIFDWQMKPTSNEPMFEGVMISTSGQQGISFTTTGKRIQ